MKDRITEIFFPNRIINIALALLLMYIATCIGCTPKVKKEYPEKIITPTFPEELQDYATYLKQNMANMDEKYSSEYVPFDFVVDTDYGSTLMQNLIDPEAVSSIVNELNVNDLEYEKKISHIYEYVISEYAFNVGPFGWQAVEETIKAKKGDCKHLSLLLMSLLLSADIDAHVAISNGHMWVNVFYNNNWHILEVDQDSERNKIYQIPRFYKNPLYKIYTDHTVKLKRLHSP